MSFNETFNSGPGSYAIVGNGISPPDNGEFDGGIGNSAPGSVKLYYSNGLQVDGNLDNGVVNTTGDTHLVLAGDNFYFNYKVVGGDPGDVFWIVAQLRSQIPITFIEIDVPASGGEAWQQSATDLTAYVGITLTSVVISCVPGLGGTPYHCYIDSVHFGPTPPTLTPDALNYELTRSAGGVPGSVAI